MGIEALPDAPLREGGPLSERFRALGLTRYRDAALWVRDLPYGRNSSRTDISQVISERRGTCSSKHALLAELARENALPVALRLGVYAMDGKNTPGVGKVLAANDLDAVPEAHCYLFASGQRIDLTRAGTTGEVALAFLDEREIAPADVAEWKPRWHRAFVETWARERGLDPDRVWKIREACIAALEGTLTVKVSRARGP